MTRLLIIGSLSGELGQAARIANARGASLAQADGVASGLAHLRGEGADLVLAEVIHDLPWMLERLARSASRRRSSPAGWMRMPRRCCAPSAPVRASSCRCRPMPS
jgi:hypothetical protein